MTEDRETKNQVFQQDAPPQVQPDFPKISKVEAVKAEFGLDIPSERIPLPSAGLLYPVNHSLHNTGFVEIRPMTTREEDILTSQALLKKGTVITELIRSCLVDKTIEPLDLVTGDRNALMISIRISGYGHEYDAEIQCSECDAISKHSFDLTQLGINRLGISPTSPGVNEFAFTLPKSKFNCTFRFLTGRDEQEIVLTQERQRKQGMISSNRITAALQHSLVSVNGNTDRSQLSKFITNMPAFDSLALREFMKKNEPGIDMTQEITCGACGHVEEVSMPIGVNFLWPGSAG